MSCILFILGSLLAAPSPVVAHNYFVSTTNIWLNNQQGEMQIAIKCAGHDVEKWFAKRQETVKLDNGDKAVVQQKLEQLLAEKFIMVIDGKAAKLKFEGYEISTSDELELFLSVALPAGASTLSVTNSLLCDLFPLQENIIHIHAGGKKNTGVCTRNSDPYTFQIPANE
jgi:hypothetical protein